MFFTSLFRIIKFSLQDISRNVWLSLVTVIILILALFSLNMLVVVKVVSDTAIQAVKQKVDVNLYVSKDASEDDILALKSKINDLSEVKSVDYVSKQEALESFKKQNADNPQVMKALQLMDTNPLTPNLIIKPKSPDKVQALTHELNKIQSPIIESRNFVDHRTLLEKIRGITDKVNTAGMVVSSIFILITLLVIYNAVRVAIYTHHQEITIMRLVGASSFFIYTPFLLSSIIYTLIGVVITIGLLYPFLGLLQPYLQTFFVGYNINLVSYFNSNFLLIFGIQFGCIALVNILASLIAIRKYAHA